MDLSATNHCKVCFSPEDLAETGSTEEMLVAMDVSQNDTGIWSTVAAHSNFSVSVPSVVSLSNQEMRVQTTDLMAESTENIAPVSLVDQTRESGVSIQSETLASQSTVSASEPSNLQLSNQEMHTYSQEFLVELPGDRSLVPLDDETIKDTVDVIVGHMIGHAKYLEMEKADSGLCDVLLSSLPKRLRDLQNKGNKDIENTLPLLDELLEKRTDIEQELQEIGETLGLLKKQKENELKLNKKLDKIYFPLSLKLRKTTDNFLPGLLSKLPESLKFIEEKNEFVVTLEEVKNEASKWIYFHMRGQNQKVAAHPQHIKNIPGVWRSEHPGCKTDCNPLCKSCKRTCYPPEIAYQSIASYTGLDIDQVVYLFHNDRKRTAPKDPTVKDDQLKKHFDKGAIAKLRKWEAKNPGKELDKASLKELMGATGMNIEQIRNWFGNNTQGRVNRNLSSKRTLSQT